MQDASLISKSQLTAADKLMWSPEAIKFRQQRQLERSGVQNGYYKTLGTTADGKAPGQIVKADGRIRTVNDLIDYHYGFLPEYYSTKKSGMAKADNPLLTTDTGVRNALYGSEVFIHMNTEANVFSLLENRPWLKSGERYIDALGHAAGSGGLGENASLPDTAHPEFGQFTVDPATVGHFFDVSQVKQLLSETQDDDLDDPFDFLRRYYGTGTEHQIEGEHPGHINKMFTQDTDTLAGDNFESIDRAISNGAESALLSDAADNDIYGFDRSANEFESNVIHNGGSNETFYLSKMDEAIKSVRESSGKDPVAESRYFWLTGWDTVERIEDEVGGKERLEKQRVTTGLNGVNTVPGQDVGITVSSYKNIPIFASRDIQKDGLSRIYLVDAETMYFKTLLPTQFYSTGTEVDQNPFTIDRLGNEGGFVTIGQLSMTNPVTHAKIRDLK